MCATSGYQIASHLRLDAQLGSTRLSLGSFPPGDPTQMPTAMAVAKIVVTPMIAFPSAIWYIGPLFQWKTSGGFFPGHSRHSGTGTPSKGQISSQPNQSSRFMTFS